MTGREHEQEFQPGFHDRLARMWPEPRDQLHAGGWMTTRFMVRQLGISQGQRVMDLCCGEGGTAVWLASTLGVQILGIDIIKDAVLAARDNAVSGGVGSLATFVQGNIFSLPVTSESFDVLMGQDPDGLAHGQRLVAFQEGFRVLRPGGKFGIHHWIPGLGAPPALSDEFDWLNRSLGYPSHWKVTAEAYLEAMAEAGFIDIRVVDKSQMYRKHMEGVRSRSLSEDGQANRWTDVWLELSRRHPFGVAMFGEKPPR